MNTLQRTTWSRLGRQTRIDLYISGDKQVPHDYDPEYDEMCLARTPKTAGAQARAAAKARKDRYKLDARMDAALEELHPLSTRELVDLARGLQSSDSPHSEFLIEVVKAMIEARDRATTSAASSPSALAAASPTFVSHQASA